MSGDTIMHVRLPSVLTAAFCAALAGGAPAGADPVNDWNEAVSLVAAPAAGSIADRPPAVGIRAQTALAIFEAVNAIDRRYRSYVDMPVGARDASQEAAVAAAAHTVLKAKFAAKASALDEALAFDLGEIADGPAETTGVEIGRAAAARVLARALSPADAVVPFYRPRTSPGVYVPTDLPVLPMSAYVTRCWFLGSAAEVAPPPPPALGSERYRRDWDEVRRLGGKTSAERTPAQTAAANFWAGNESQLALRLLMDRERRSLVRNARTYALLAMALDDAAAAVTVAKYENGFWRPITAIRNAEDDGDPLTAADPGWEPLLRTPLHPEYPCGHCIFAATTARIVEAEFGAAPRGGLTFLDPSIPGAGRTVATPAEYVREVSMSRVYGGVHYRFSNEAAEAMGRRVAEIALRKGMQPLQ